MAQNLQTLHQEFVQLGRQLDTLQNALVEQGVAEKELPHTYIDRAADALVEARAAIASHATVQDVQAGDAVERERLLSTAIHFGLVSEGAELSDFELTNLIQGSFEYFLSRGRRLPVADPA